MKVLMITTSFPYYKGHSQSPFIYNLAKSLVKKGIKIELICPFYTRSVRSEEIMDGIHVHRFHYWFPLKMQKLTEGGGIPSSLKSSLRTKIQFSFFILSMFLKSQKFVKGCDVIHAQWALSGFVGVILKKIFKKPLILTTRGATVNMALKNKLIKKALLFILDNCDYVTPNNKKHGVLIEKMGIQKNKINPIPNGIDTDVFKPGKKSSIRKKLGVPMDKQIILFVG